MPQHGSALVRPIGYRRELPSTISVLHSPLQGSEDVPGSYERPSWRLYINSSEKVVDCDFSADCSADDFLHLAHIPRAIRE